MTRCGNLTLRLVSVLILAVPAIGLSQGKAGDLTLRPYVFQTLDKQTVDAEFGRLLVPENRRNPQSRLIELVFVRFKSTSPTPGSPIVYLAGGPGGSGIGAARTARFPLFMAMREFGDVVALDQRGEGDSVPNTFCRETYSLPLDQPLTRDAALRIVRERSRACADDWRGRGVDLSGYTTSESADDLETLRVALGAKKLSLWGISYGTHLALATIKRHESSIDRAILAGVEGLDDTLKSPAEVQQHLGEIARLVRADPALNREIPDFLGLMRAVLDRLDKEPVTVHVADPKTQQDRTVVINRYVMQLLTASAVGTDAITFFPRLYHAASNGDFWNRAPVGDPLGFEHRLRDGVHDGLRVRRVTGAAAADCARSAGTLLGNAADIVFPEVCDAWGSPDLGPGFRAPVRSAVPVLFISGTLDGRTPAGGAEAARRGFPTSVHLIIEGAWHGNPLFLSSPGIKDVMAAFMRGASVSTTRSPFRLPGSRP